MRYTLVTKRATHSIRAFAFLQCGKVLDLWFQTLASPGRGNDNIGYNRFNNPEFALKLRNGHVSLTDESVNHHFKEMEFKVSLRDSEKINHPFEAMNILVVEKLPDIENLNDNKDFTCDVLSRHKTHIIIGNIHKQSGRGTVTIGSTMNCHTIHIIGFRELLECSLSAFASLEIYSLQQTNNKHIKNQNNGGSKSRKRRVQET